MNNSNNHNHSTESNMKNSNNNNYSNNNGDPHQQLYLQQKIEAIESILQHNNNNNDNGQQHMIDVWALRAMAITNGGLVNDTIRRQAWPKLVGLHAQIWDFTTTTTPTNSSDNHHHHHHHHGSSRGDNTTTRTRAATTTTTATDEESFVTTPKRSNVVHGGVERNESATVTDTTTTTTSTENAGRQSSNTITTAAAATTTTTIEQQSISTTKKKVQDIFRSEVNIKNTTTKINPNHNDCDIDTNSIASSTASGGTAGSTTSSKQSSSSTSSVMTLRHKNHNPHHTILASSIDASQIQLDVLRCTWHLLTKAQKRTQQQYGCVTVHATTATTTTTSSSSFSQTQQSHTTTPSSSSSSGSKNRRKLRKIAKMIQRKQNRLSNLINLTLVQSSVASLSHSTITNSNRSSSSSSGDSGTTTPNNDNNLLLLLRYYQGYHDVACIILSTIGISTTHSKYVPPVVVPVPVTFLNGRPFPLTTTTTPAPPTTTTGFEMATSILYQLSQSHFRDCMRNNFTQLQIVMRLTIFPLLNYFDSEVHEHLMLSDMMEPYFCLSWIITWFSHDIRDTELVKRLFDFFIVSHPIMPIYMTIAMICHPFNRQDVLQTEHDFSTVHQTLSQLPRNSSMVGWKYRPGDGYVSDDDDNTDGHSSDDDDMDDDLLSVGPMGSQSSVDTEFLFQEAATMKQSNNSNSGTGNGRGAKITATADSTDSYVADAEAVSIVSSSMSSMYNARVPFQELIDLAIQYIGRIPPNQLIVLATRYYGHEYVQKELFSASSSQAPPTTKSKSGVNFSHPIRDDITFLQSPPAWTRSYTAHSDQALKHHRTQQCRRSKSMPVNKTEENAAVRESTTHPQTDVTNETDEMVSMYKLFQSNGDTGKLMAVIAAGYGMGDDTTERRVRRQRKQRKRFIQAGTALAVMVVAIGIGYYIQQQQQNNRNGKQQPQSTTGTVGTGTSLDGSICTTDDVVQQDLFSKMTSNTIITTSSKTSNSRIPITVAPDRRTDRTRRMDTKQVCTTQKRHFFDRTCPTGSPTARDSLKGTDRILRNRRNGQQGIVEGDSFDGGEFGMASFLQYENAARNLLLFGKQIRSIGMTFIVSPALNSANKSKHLLLETRKAFVQKSRDFQPLATSLRHSLDGMSHQIGELFQSTCRDGVTRLKNGINDKKQGLVVSTTKVVSVMKSAMLEYGNDVVAGSNKMDAVDVATSSPPPSIIATLRKNFEPSDLNIVSSTLHSILRHALYNPIINTINKIRYSGDALPLGQANNQQPFTILMGKLNLVPEMITNQLKRFGDCLSDTIRKIVNDIKSAAVNETLRSSPLLEHLDQKQSETMGAPKVESNVIHDNRHIDQLVNTPSTYGENDNVAAHAIAGEDRCSSDLSLSKKKKLSFVK